MPNYALVAGLILYILVVRGIANSRLRPLAASLITVVGYTTLSVSVSATLASGYGIPLWHFVGLLGIITPVLQFCAAIVVFSKLANSGDSYIDWIAYVVGGGGLIFFVAPFVATKLAITLG